jgi:hypothetical protein
LAGQTGQRTSRWSGGGWRCHAGAHALPWSIRLDRQRALWFVEALRSRLLHYFSMDERLEPNAKDKYQQAFEITYPE